MPEAQRPQPSAEFVQPASGLRPHSRASNAPGNTTLRTASFFSFPQVEQDIEKESPDRLLIHNAARNNVAVEALSDKSSSADMFRGGGNKLQILTFHGLQVNKISIPMLEDSVHAHNSYSMPSLSSATPATI